MSCDMRGKSTKSYIIYRIQIKIYQKDLIDLMYQAADYHFEFFEYQIETAYVFACKYCGGCTFDTSVSDCSDYTDKMI